MPYLKAEAGPREILCSWRVAHHLRMHQAACEVPGGGGYKINTASQFISLCLILDLGCKVVSDVAKFLNAVLDDEGHVLG